MVNRYEVAKLALRGADFDDKRIKLLLVKEEDSHLWKDVTGEFASDAERDAFVEKLHKEALSNAYDSRFKSAEDYRRYVASEALRAKVGYEGLKDPAVQALIDKEANSSLFDSTYTVYTAGPAYNKLKADLLAEAYQTGPPKWVLLLGGAAVVAGLAWWYRSP